MEGVSAGIYEYLHNKNRKNLYIYPVTNNENEKKYIPSLYDFYHQKDLNTIENKDMIQIVALFPGSESVFITDNNWFQANSFSRHEFLGNYVVYVKK